MATVARRRRARQVLDPVDRDLERRIDAVIASFVNAPDPEARISAWHGFMALRDQRAAAHIEQLERERLQRCDLCPESEPT
jgi:hypothetical protein